MKTHILCLITSFSNVVLFMRKCRKMWWSGKSQTIWRTHVACWVYKATRARTHTHSCRHVHTHARASTPTCTHKQKYVILIAFPRQHWFRERASVSRYTYIASLVILYSHLKFTTRSICFIFSYLVSSNREAPHYSVFPSILHDKNM